MDCQDCVRLADAWADGELDAAGAADPERHLRQCPGCGRRAEAQASLSAAVRAAPLYAAAPAGLERRVRAALHREAGLRPLPPPWRAAAYGGAARWGAAAAAVLL